MTFTGVGETTVTAVCSDDPEVTASVTVRALQLAEDVAFDSLDYTVSLGDSAQLYASVLPVDTADPSLSYKSADPSVATVDENGVVTGVSAGRTTVYATAADGSNKRASTTVTVVVPVTGVGYPYKDVRVGVGESESFTAVLAPEGATDTRMTWQSGDESVATVSGTGNRFAVLGRGEGRCKLTGVTQDGGYTVTVYVDVGSLQHAAVITEIGLRDGKPYVVVRNLSGMELTQVRFRIRGYDEAFAAVPVGTGDEAYVLSGAVNVVLAAGESSTAEDTVLYHAADCTGLAAFQACVTGWTTTTGFYDANGQLQKNYNIRQSAWEWVAWPASATTGLSSE